MQSPLSLGRPALVAVDSSSLNAGSHGLSNTKKRKSDEPETHGACSEVFTATFVSVKTQIWAFEPLTLLARACLPLAWLNTAQPLPTSVFEATIPLVQEWEQRVLVARKTPNGGLFAIERVGPNHFIACPLQNWVSEEYCKDAAVGKVAQTRLEEVLQKDDGVPREHRRSISGSSLTALPTPKSPRRPTNRRGALARMSILTPKETTIQDAVDQSPSSPSFTQPVITAPISAEPLPITPAAQIQNVDPFDQTLSASGAEPPIEEPRQPEHVAPVENPCAAERLRGQYLDYLYTSKTSLAFYVKGPLSRARAHVRSSECPSTSIADLLEFYEQSILATKKIDLKYKESLPKIITELPLEHPDIQKKRSRKKKQKLGKDCLWPEEDDYVSKWWRAREFKPSSASSDRQAEMRKELADLRMRETKMQLLLILEVMLLELAASKLSAKPVPSDANIKVESVEDEIASILAKTPQKSTKKKRDFTSELETLVDRLCIWHSVDMDEITDHEKSQTDSKVRANDLLREFCKDVLWPFYSAKLPEQMKSLSRKLAGSDFSPKRPQESSKPPTLRKTSASFSLHKPKPGQPLVKRTLQRVLSEDQLGRHASPPTLSRSSTGPINPIIPTLKREPSERPVSRGGMLSKSVSFSNREIDLVADSKTHEAKRRKLDKLAQQKQELEAAIDALKRPSRSAVAAAFMDDVEKRRQQERTIQISATPRARRHREMVDFAEPELPPMPRLAGGEDMSIIPSSTRKPLARSIVHSSSSINRASATKRAVLSAIHETPSRGLEGKTSNPLALPAVQLTLHPPAADNNNMIRVEATPARKRAQPPSWAALDGAHSDFPLQPPSDLGCFSSSQPMSESRYNDELRMSRSQRPVLFRPVKKSDVRIEHAFRDAPEIPEHAGRMMDRVMGEQGRALDFGFDKQAACVEKSRGKSPMINDADEGDIYDRLGWNDDFDL
nr:hypothetical protein LTR18_007870 [Exophiala xenobiotica]